MDLDKDIVIKAFNRLDECLKSSKIDSFRSEIDIVAKDLKISSDWLNSNFSFFSHYLPQDYGSRLIRVFNGQNLKVDCLGSTDVLIMKFMALRQKDINHISFLLSQPDTNLDIVEKRLDELADSSDNIIKTRAEKGLKTFDKITGRGS